MIAPLAFVPTADIIQHFDVLAQHRVGNEKPILDYFENNYIGEFRQERRRATRFPHVM